MKEKTPGDIRIFVINPGSTSTKLAVFDNLEKLAEVNIKHDAKELAKHYNSIEEQMGYRLQFIKKYMEEQGIRMEDIDAFSARCGSTEGLVSGVYEVNKKMLEDDRNTVGGARHPSTLGILLGKELSDLNGARLFTVDPIGVDEFCDEARMTGINGVYRRSVCHALNIKGVCKMHGEIVGKPYEESRVIACHIDGGITFTAHINGKMIDGTNGAAGDGSYTPTRIGSLPVGYLLEYQKTHSEEEVRALLSSNGGFVSYFGSSDSDEIYAMVQAGDPKATLAWNGMIYNIAKQIGALSCVLEGKVDAIILTGRLMRFDSILEGIKKRCEWIAPIYSYPKEVEQEALAKGAYDVMTGKIEPLHYTGEPVFKGFE